MTYRKGSFTCLGYKKSDGKVSTLKNGADGEKHKEYGFDAKDRNKKVDEENNVAKRFIYLTGAQKKKVE